MKLLIKALIKKILAVGVLGLFASSAYATPVLSFGNSGSNLAQWYNVGDTVSLDLWVSGLDGTDGDGLGGVDFAGFDMNLSFNGAVTGYQNTSFSSDLDDSLFYGLSSNPTSSNSLNLSGLSLSWDLSGQASALKLFTLVFTAGQAGTSTIKLDDFLLSDSWGLDFASSSYLAEITVKDRPASVPEPSTLMLFLSALGVMAVRRRKLI
ncbi:hypothetical protein GCM10011613_11200 [Cellvibrio zantedeschiae]|uniref:Ice-binding protein C-terminal domain-containing protein n=1 Tax=Cellvibrio zantedeschiae TaxID=1237077 RepID=A0ABQ3AVI2_9GAMM|nr:PEP-CTERM sorting domain-containing protein [Cellvibrio zantedeschiae]GGY68689.1 hypothetical protein GCM10011613_11200 [Cellvibrio zantedeschiae]